MKIFITTNQWLTFLPSAFLYVCISSCVQFFRCLSSCEKPFYGDYRHGYSTFSDYVFKVISSERLGRKWYLLRVAFRKLSVNQWKHLSIFFLRPQYWNSERIDSKYDIIWFYIQVSRILLIHVILELCQHFSVLVEKQRIIRSYWN